VARYGRQALAAGQFVFGVRGYSLEVTATNAATIVREYAARVP
jgi:hypothetical protein